MELFYGLLPITGIIIGSVLTWLITRSTKRQEWRIEVNKQLIQMRIAAYEDLMSVTKGAVLASGDTNHGYLRRYPFIFDDVERYTDWTTRFTLMTGRVSHLIDSTLSSKLTNFQNYLAYLDEFLGNWNDSKESTISSANLKKIGELLYEDFRKLTSDILEDAGRFYSESIYNERFEPSTMHKKPYVLPDYFQKFALFTQQNEIRKLVG